MNPYQSKNLFRPQFKQPIPFTFQHTASVYSVVRPVQPAIPDKMTNQAKRFNQVQTTMNPQNSCDPACRNNASHSQTSLGYYKGSYNSQDFADFSSTTNSFGFRQREVAQPAPKHAQLFDFHAEQSENNCQMNPPKRMKTNHYSVQPTLKSIENLPHGSNRTDTGPETSKKVINANSKTDKPEDKKFPVKKRESKSIRGIFTGPVEKIMLWSKLKYKFDVLFEVIGILDKIRFGKTKCEKLLTIRDMKSSQALHVVFYEIDRKLPNFKIDSIVKCVGELKSRGYLQAFKVTESSYEEEAQLQHVTFICDRAVQKLLAGA